MKGNELSVRKALVIGIVGISVAATSFIGVTGAIAVTGGQSAINWLPKPNASSTPDYETNASGETVGTYGEAPTLEQLPDLVLVVTDQGTDAYVEAVEFLPPAFSSPKEALAWQEAGGDKSRVVNAYAEDGTTVVGTFTFGAAELSPEDHK